MGTKSQHAPNTILERHEKYRVFHQLADLGWVDFDLGSSFIGPIPLGRMGFGVGFGFAPERWHELGGLRKNILFANLAPSLQNVLHSDLFSIAT